MTEPGAGSDLAGIQTRAEKKGDHWVLNGSKTYISNGQIADVIIVAARTSVPTGMRWACSSSSATCRVSSAAAISRRWA